METKVAAGLMAGALLMFAGSACQDPDLTLPSAEVVSSYYSIPAEANVELNGNVAELEVRQAGHLLERGGRLWAMVGPYVYLFSEATRDLLAEYPGVAAVRVITLAPNGDEVARATLARDALNGVTWRRALNISGLARRDGTKRPTLLEDLVEWGEEHTEFRYSEAYIRRP